MYKEWNWLLLVIRICESNWFLWFFQLQRRMKIAELKQICLRPDVVEVEMGTLYCIQVSFTLKNHNKLLIPSVWLHFLVLIFSCANLFTVQIWDATAADPKLLVYLKSYRNTVPVPRHWCQKRKFLQVSNSTDVNFTVYQCTIDGYLHTREWESWVREDRVDKVSLIYAYLVLAGVWLWHCWSRNL